MKSPITYYGGKAKMIPDLAKLYIHTPRYCEPCAGGLSWFWAKQPSDFEVISDTNGNITNFYRVLKSPRMFTKLVAMAEGTAYSEFAWEEARYIYLNGSGYSLPERAWAFWMLYNCSFGGMGQYGSFQIVTHNTDKWIPPTSLKTKRESLKYYGKRLEKTMILTKSCNIIIPKFDHVDMFFYIDPPYYQACQGPYGGYTRENFIALLTICAKLKAKFLLSSYSCELLSDFVEKNKWNQKLLDKPLLVNGNSKRKIESLVYNYYVDEYRQTELLL